MNELLLPYNHIPNILLLGNGINRAFNQISWCDLLSKVKCRVFSLDEEKALEKVPYPLRAVIYSNDTVDQCAKKLSSDLCAFTPPREETELLSELLNIPFDAILTTNYSYEIEKTLYPDFHISPGKRNKFRKTSCVESNIQKKNHLHRYFLLKDSKQNQHQIWHIHGEAALSSTMIIGHYYYGYLLSRLQSYSGNFMARYKASLRSQNGYICHSWMDYIMLGNIYVVGLGMDFSEMDLWWLVNCKKRNCDNLSKIELYKPDASPELRMLADAYGVKINDTVPFKFDFILYYSNVIKHLKSTVTSIL